MSKVSFEQLLEAGVHFGHLKRKWNPKMAPYIFDEKKGIHIIDLNKTLVKLEVAGAAMKQIAKSGKKILFVATKKQARDIIADGASSVNMPYVTERWTGGMMTNFATTRKSIRKMTNIDKMKTDGTWETLNKRERLFKDRQRDKLEKTFGSISDMSRLPAAIFIVDILKEDIAVAEAVRLNIPTFAMVDTNSDPTKVDFAIPANDDASKSIGVVMEYLVSCIKEGLEDRKSTKDKGDDEDGEEKPARKAKAEKPAVEEAPVEVEALADVVVEEAPANEEKPARKAKAEKPAVEDAPAKEAPAKKDATSEEVLAAKKAKLLEKLGTNDGSQKDNLKLLSGVGPKFEETLNGMGVFTYEQVSKMGAEEYQLLDELTGKFPGRAEREDWAGQAAKLK
jgi:small subunit ribosomal protein S2